MMKNNWIVWLALSLIVLIVVILVIDLFSESSGNTKNIYEYKLDQFKKVDSNLVCYKEAKQIGLSVKGLHAIATDKEDNIYLSANNTILKYNSNGDSLSSFNVNDTVFCIGIGKNNALFIGLKDRIVHLDSKGNLIKIWDNFQKSSYITSVAVYDTSVFIADAGNKIVHRFDLSGKRKGLIGKKDKSKGIPGFIIPSPYFDVAVDKNGQLWAVNTGYHAFEAYTYSGELITRWAKASMQIDGFSGCCNPAHIAILSNGDFVTSEKGMVRIKIHSPNGNFKCVVAGAGKFGEAVEGPDLAVDSKDRILVLDAKKNRILIFSKSR